MYEIPLLEVEVPEEVWQELQQTSIHQVSWIGRARRGIVKLGKKTLADVAQISKTEWMKLKGFDQTSFVILKHRFQQLINDIRKDSIPSEACQEDVVDFWRAKGLSIRASNCLAKAGISGEDGLKSQLTRFDQILELRNCGRLTAEEIWLFIKNIEPEPTKTDSQFSYEHLSQSVENALQLLEVPQNQPLSAPVEELSDGNLSLQIDEKKDNTFFDTDTIGESFEETRLAKKAEENFSLDSVDGLDEFEIPQTQEKFPRAAIDTYRMWLRRIQRIQPQIRSADNQYTTKRLSAAEEVELFHRLEIAKQKGAMLLDQFPSWTLEKLSQGNSPQEHNEKARNRNLLLENVINSRKSLEQIRETIGGALVNGEDSYQNHETTKLKQLWGDLSSIVEEIQGIKHKIIESNLRLVLNIATQCRCRNMEKMDLVQEGHIGLMKAIDRFDVHRGYRFSTYATWWIRQAVWRARDGNAGIIRLPNYILEKRSKFLQSISRLSQQLQSEPTYDEIANDLELSVDQVDAFFNHPTSDFRLGQRLIPQTLSEYQDWCDAVNAEDDLHDEVQTWHTPPELRFLSELSEFGEIRDYRGEIASILPPRERRNLEEPLGWNDGNPKPSVEIGAVLAIVRERERQRWLGCEPTLEEVFDAVGIPSSVIDEIQKVVSPPLTLDQPIKSETLAELVLKLSQVCSHESPPELLINEAQVSPEEEFQSRLNKEALNQILETLSPRETQVIKLRYGLNDGAEHTLAEIGQQLNVSRERIRQIEKEALDKLHHPTRLRRLEELLQSRVYPLDGSITRTSDILAPKSRTIGKPRKSDFSFHAAVDDKKNVPKTTAGVVSSLSREDAVSFWRAKGLSVRVANCLAKADIFNDAQLVERLTSFDEIRKLKSCGRLTAEEIWRFIKSETSDQDIFTELVMKLQSYGYRPLTLDECCKLQQKRGESQLDPDQLLDAITNHPKLKVYQYGKRYIGLKAWTWFDPEKTMTTKGKADLVEWFFRMTNEPATTKAVADSIWSELGNFRITPFEVADCR